MNEAAYKKLSLLIKKYCPDFLEEKYPKFIAFLQAYYDWSMNKDAYNPAWVVNHLIEWGDIDETIDEFINYFKAEYLDQLNVDFNGDIVDFIKHTKEFYSSRGTPESFRFLLKLLSGNSGEIFYPNQYLMKSSDGIWVKDHCIFLQFNDTITGDFLSTKIKGKISGVTGIIENIETHFNYNTQEQFLKVYVSSLSGTLTDDVVILSKDGINFIEIPVYNTISGLKYISRGNQYKVNDPVSIAGDPTFVGRVSSVSTGKVDSYVILNGGSNYSIGDEIFVESESVDTYYAMPKIYVDEVDENGAITSLDIRYSGYGFYNVPSLDHINTQNPSSTGAEIEFISDSAGSIKMIDVVSAEINYTDNTLLTISSTNGTGAEIRISTGKVFTTIPYYYKPGSFLSDEFKLQDSDYWQEYSYEIRSSLTLDNDVLTQFSEYKDIFKQLVHPAGFKLFNSFVLSNHIDLHKIYINSEFDLGYVATFIDFANWIEMVSCWNRIVDNDIIFQHRFATIGDNENTQINYYERTGGEYVHSTLEIE